jgi:tRNA modification GTPase
LFNQLLKQDRAIVTSQAGTTRDTIEKAISIAGHTVVLVDTAGLRDTKDEAELSGVDRSNEEISRADLVVLVHAPDTENISLSLPDDAQQITVYNKVDLDTSPPKNKDIYTSCSTGSGLESLHNAIYSHVINISSKNVQGVVLSNERHRDVFNRFLEQVSACISAAGASLGPEYVASDLRLALDILGEITGKTTPDDILNQIFSGFCVGK